MPLDKNNVVVFSTTVFIPTPEQKRAMEQEEAEKKLEEDIE